MVCGKSMGAGLPINCVVISDKIQGVSMDGIDLHTFGNNQLSQVASLKMIEIIERDDLLGNVKRIGSYLKDRLESIAENYECIGEVRALGFHIGLEFVIDRESRQADYAGCMAMRDIGFKNGIIFGVGGSGMGKNVLKIKPPLITTKEQADEVLTKFEATLKEVYKK